MGTVVFRRGPRAEGPPMPSGQLELAERPVLTEPGSADMNSMIVFLPMGVGAATMVLMFSIAKGSTETYLISGMMGTSMMAMGVGQLSRNGHDRTRRTRAERRDYLRYLA